MNLYFVFFLEVVFDILVGYVLSLELLIYFILYFYWICC